MVPRNYPNGDRANPDRPAAITIRDLPIVLRLLVNGDITLTGDVG